MTENYYLIDSQTNVCVDIIVWDGNDSKWSVPENHFALPSSTTKVKNWFHGGTQENPVIELKVVEEHAVIGYTWDGEYLTTNQTLEEFLALDTTNQTTN